MTNDNYSDYHELSYRERWELKREAIILKRRKMIASMVQMAIIVIAIVLFLMVLSACPSNKEGHYRYKDGNADGTGVFYEYVIDED